MKCTEVNFGTYDCSYNIKLPYLVKFPYESDDKLRTKFVSIDKCLLPEILELWKMGIKTTGNCCGHSKWEPTICVPEFNIQRMKNLGYKLIDDKGIFEAKTEVEKDTEAFKKFDQK